MTLWGWLLMGGLSGWAQVVLHYEFDNLGKPIPDNDLSGLTDVRNLISQQWIVDVNVWVRIEGDTIFNGDYYVYLEHEGQVSVLMNRVGRTVGNGDGYGDGGFWVTLDDQAANGDIHLYRSTILGNDHTPLGTPLTDETYEGGWAPDGRLVDPRLAVDTDSRTALLDVFNGMCAGGEWTLYIVDAAGGGTGTLEGWGLEITVVPEPANGALLVGLLCLGFSLLRKRHAD